MDNLSPTLDSDNASPATGKPSRRSLLGAIAALSAAAVPPIAAAAAADPDPIFALIEAARRAKVAAEAAGAIEDRLFEKVGQWQGVNATIGFKERYGERRELTYKALFRDDLVKWLDGHDPAALDRVRIEINVLLAKHGQKGYPEGLSSAEDRSRYSAERGDALKKFDEARRDFEAKREASGLREAEDRAQRALEVSSDSHDAVMKAAPRTPSGAAALLVYASEYAATEPEVDGDEIAPVLVNVAAFLAGKPVEISVELEEVLDGERI